MKKKVNLIFLNYLTAPLNGEADDDEMVKKYLRINPNDELSIKDIIKTKLLPAFNSRSSNFRDKIKIALSYALSSEMNLGGEFDSNLLPFDSPDDPNIFYKWIWEVFFPDQKFQMNDIGTYEAIEDLNEPLHLSLIEKQKN